VRCFLGGGSSAASRFISASAVSTNGTPSPFGLYSYRPSSSRLNLDSATGPDEPTESACPAPATTARSSIAVSGQAFTTDPGTSSERTFDVCVTGAGLTFRETTSQDADPAIYTLAR